MAQPGVGEQVAKGPAAVGRTVVAHHALDGDAVAGEEGQRVAHEGDGAVFGLVGQDGRIGEAQGIVDRDVQNLQADAALAVAAVAGDAMADALDAAELLRVDADEVTGPLALVADDRRLGIECAQPAEAELSQHGAYGGARNGEPVCDGLAAHAGSSQRFNLGALGRGDTKFGPGWRRAPVVKHPRAARPEARQPFVGAALAEAGRLCGVRHAPAFDEDPMRKKGSTMDGHAGILVGVHPRRSDKEGSLKGRVRFTPNARAISPRRATGSSDSTPSVKGASQDNGNGIGSYGTTAGSAGLGQSGGGSAGQSRGAHAAVDEPRLKIVPDDVKNSLLIMANEKDYRRILQVIRTTDVVPSQVLIEAAVAEVTLNDALQYGVKWQLQKNGSPTASFSDLAAGGVAAAFPGFNYALKLTSIAATLSALNANTHANVISAPSLMVLDNKTAALPQKFKSYVTRRIRYRRSYRRRRPAKLVFIRKMQGEEMNEFIQDFIQKGSRGACYILENYDIYGIYNTTCVGFRSHDNYIWAGYVFWFVLLSSITVSFIVISFLFRWVFE